MAREKKRWIQWSIGLIILALGVSAGSSGCADELVLGSNHDRVDPGRAVVHAVTVDGKHVEYWAARSPGAATQPRRAIVLMFTGKGDRADRWVAMVADSWGDKPVEVFGMNYPGAGGSDSPGKLTEVLPAALGVYDAVQAAAGTRRVFIQAASFGTAVALAVAARRPVSGLILQNPVPLRQLLVGHYGWWNLWLAAVPVAARVPPELGSIENAKHVTAPAVFISSGNDEVVPPQFHRLVIDGYAGPKRLIEMPGASHAAALTAAAAAELQVDRDWLWNHDAITPGNTGSP